MDARPLELLEDADQIASVSFSTSTSGSRSSETTAAVATPTAIPTAADEARRRASTTGAPVRRARWWGRPTWASLFRAECANDSDCDDGLSYTSDTCDGGECVHNWSGVAGSSVTQSEYELLSECSRDSDCDDGNLSTQDSCAGGVCEHEGTAVRDACETISCSDGNPFTEDTCSNGTCSHATMVIR